MSRTIAYHRPNSVDEAIALLESTGETGAERVLLGGGTVVNAAEGTEREVIDLQSLGLNSIVDEGESVRLDAMVRLQQLVDSPAVPSAVRDAAKSELPSTLRTVSTVGGTVGEASGESVVIAALLVHEAEVSYQSAAGAGTEPLADWLADSKDGRAVVTAVTIASGGQTASARTGRTPADVPIVSAVARRSAESTLVAVTGVAPTPVLVDSSAPTDGLQPTADFRGSADYRLDLVRILTGRVVEEVGK